MQRFGLVAALGWAIFLLVSACGAGATATVVPEAKPTSQPPTAAALAPTATQVPTSTLNPTLTKPLPTASPTATLAPTATMTATEIPALTATTPPTVALAPTPTAVPTTAPPPTVAATPTQAPPALVVSSVTIVPSKDSTLYQQSEGSLGNGAGQHIFVGKTNQGSVRRGVIAFDVSGSIPQGSIIIRVSLTMNVSRTEAATQDIQLHRLLTDWSEGPSDAIGQEGGGTAAEAGDVTWVHTRFDSANWQLPGGDFFLEPSAVQQVGGVGQYTWQSTDQMVADVQEWLDGPSTGFGWLLLGNEGTNRTAKRFDSKEHGTEANRPRLTIVFDSP